MGRTDADGHVSLAVHITDTTQVSVIVSEGHTYHSQAGMQHTPILPFIQGLPEIPPRPGWSEKVPMLYPPSLKAIRDGGWLTSDTTRGLVFAAKGNNTKDFYSYNPAGDSWLRQADIPPGREEKWPRQGCRGVADDSGNIYMTKGNNTLGFWRYDIVENVWYQLPDVPLGTSKNKVRIGSDLVYVRKGDTGFVYLLKGYRWDFMRLRVTGGPSPWELLQSVPLQSHTWRQGSWLVFDGDHTIYAHNPRYRQMWQYDVSTGEWNDSPIAGMPGQRRPGDGSCAAWYNGCIYALKGNNRQEFWRYDPDEDTWTELDWMPSLGSSGMRKGVKSGADIIPVPGHGLYATRGNKTNELWRYWPAPPEALLAGAPSPGGSAPCGPTLGGEEPLMDGLEASKPRWNWQGDMVCYSKTDTLTEREQIYQCQYGLSTPEQRVVDIDEDCEEPVYSPDGQYIAFQLDDTVSGFYQLCVTPSSDTGAGGGGGPCGRDKVSQTPVCHTDATGGASAVAPVTETKHQVPISKSVEESRRAVCAGLGIPGGPASLGPVWQITFADADHCYPEWSPDGEWLCYERDDANGYTQIWRVPAFGGTEQQLTFGNSDHFLPDYLNSSEIVFTLSPNDDYDKIAKVHDSTHQVTVLSAFDTDHDKPSPAWDGSDVAAEAVDDTGNTQIVRMMGPAGETWLTSGDADITEPDYGQDNRTIFAVRWTGSTSQIVWVDAVNGGYYPVTDSLAIRDNPDAYVDTLLSTALAVYEREAWIPGGLLLGGGRRKHGSGVYLSRFRKRRPRGGAQGASLGVFALDKAKPNPATNRVTIRWQVPVEADVSLRVYNTAGQLVKVLADGKCKPGAYTSVWNGTDAKGRRLANGVYFYALDNDTKRISRKVILTE